MEWKDLEKGEEPKNGEIVLIVDPRSDQFLVASTLRWESTGSFTFAAEPSIVETEYIDDVRYWLPIPDLP